MRIHDHAFIGFVGDGVPDYALLRGHARSARLVLVLAPQVLPTTRRALEQMRLGGIEIELIDETGIAGYTFEEVAKLARRDLGVVSVEALPPPLAPPTHRADAPRPAGMPVRFEALGVGTSSHRAIRHARVRADAAAQLFFQLTPNPQTIRIQVEIRAPWPAVLTFDRIALIDAHESVTFDPMLFEQHIAHFNAMPLGLDERGFTLLCAGGTMVLQLTELSVATLPDARLLELMVRGTPLRRMLDDDLGIRAIGHPEDRLTLAAAHLAARTRRLESALT